MAGSSSVSSRSSSRRRAPSCTSLPPSTEDAPRRRIAVLGSTGSIGTQTLDVLASHAEAFEVVALAGGANRALLEEQVARFRPRVAALADGSALDVPAGTAVERAAGDVALVGLASREDVDLVVVATGGIVSLRPVLAALRSGKIVATANKETLVAGGHLVMPLAHKLAAASAASDPDGPYASALAWLRPIDSEHSAIWQCLV